MGKRSQYVFAVLACLIGVSLVALVGVLVVETRQVNDGVATLQERVDANAERQLVGNCVLAEASNQYNPSLQYAGDARTAAVVAACQTLAASTPP